MVDEGILTLTFSYALLYRWQMDGGRVNPGVHSLWFMVKELLLDCIVRGYILP